MRSLAADLRVQRGGFLLEAALEVAPGEVVAVVGPNGAGKTTLVRAVAALPSYDGRCGLVFQDHRLFPHLTVLDNVAFGPRARGSARRDARAKARSWLERLDLAELSRRRPGQLSGGQAQRVAIARALATDPDVLLLDEPMSALDAQAKLEVRHELRRVLADFAGPTVMVTHDPLEALVLADRIVVLESGRVTQVGTPAQVASRPRTPFVARLVGVNLLPGRLAGDVVSLDGGGAVSAVDLPSAETVLVAVRPSAITVTRQRPEASTRNVWPGRIEHLELLGDRVRLQVAGTPSLLVDVTPAAVADLGLAVDEEVFLSAKATDVAVYEA